MKKWIGLTVCAGACLFIQDRGSLAQQPAPATRPVMALQVVEESTGPVPARSSAAAGQRTTGAGFWKFVAADEGILPLPNEINDKVVPAHGTLIVDRERDIVYWGLKGVGWVEFSQKLTKSRVIKGDAMFTTGNIHGAELFPRPGKPPLVVSTDDEENEVYVSDTTFTNARKLEWPNRPPYTQKTAFKPTDATFIGENEAYITDGYGSGFIAPISTSEVTYKGSFIGGRQELSRTPHGITRDPGDEGLYISARPEGQVKKWYPGKQEYGQTLALPPGNTICDIDLWGDYALAPCLDGGNPAARGQARPSGPVYILNLKTNSIAATLRPQAELGFADALHIHDATWYVMGEGDQREVYILFTNWNPGGIHAMKLVK